MTLMKILSENFDPAYVKPRILARAVRELVPVTSVNQGRPFSSGFTERRMEQRRARQRRQQQRRVLLELRNPQSRRTSPGRRHSDYRPPSNGHSGIDTYA